MCGISHAGTNRGGFRSFMPKAEVLIYFTWFYLTIPCVYILLLFLTFEKRKTERIESVRNK
jgi:hypothetical protein